MFSVFYPWRNELISIDSAAPHCRHRQSNVYKMATSTSHLTLFSWRRPVHIIRRWLDLQIRKLLWVHHSSRLASSGITQRTVRRAALTRQ